MSHYQILLYKSVFLMMLVKFWKRFGLLNDTLKYSVFNGFAKSSLCVFWYRILHRHDIGALLEEVWIRNILFSQRSQICHYLQCFYVMIPKSVWVRPRLILCRYRFWMKWTWACLECLQDGVNWVDTNGYAFFLLMTLSAYHHLVATALVEPQFSQVFSSILCLCH